MFQNKIKDKVLKLYSDVKSAKTGEISEKNYLKMLDTLDRLKIIKVEKNNKEILEEWKVSYGKLIEDDVRDPDKAWWIVRALGIWFYPKEVLTDLHLRILKAIETKKIIDN